MNKMLLQLSAELRKLGAQVVFADHHTLILCTGKSDLAAAIGYTDYLLAAIRGRELFRWLDMVPVNVWHCLLFMDACNRAGLVASVPQDVKECMATQPGTLSQVRHGTTMLAMPQHP